MRFELKANYKLIALLDEGVYNGINYTKWSSLEGLQHISSFSNGVGPSMKQLVKVDQQTKELKPTQFYQNCKDLNLQIHVYTFRVDSLPKFATNYRHLLKIFTEIVQVDGVFTDFPDLTIKFLNNSNRIATASLTTLLISFILYVCIVE